MQAVAAALDMQAVAAALRVVAAALREAVGVGPPLRAVAKTAAAEAAHRLPAAGLQVVAALVPALARSHSAQPTNTDSPHTTLTLVFS